MAEIRMRGIISSNIIAAGYDKDKKILKITFKNGSSYEYSGVPEIMYNGMFTADSAGKFVRENIVGGKYKFKKL